MSESVETILFLRHTKTSVVTITMSWLWIKWLISRTMKRASDMTEAKRNEPTPWHNSVTRVCTLQGYAYGSFS